MGSRGVVGAYRRALLTAGFVFLSISLAARQQANQQTSGTASATAGGQNSAVGTGGIHVAARLVQVGVIVRDKNGAVAGLTKDDFQVFDRGVEQKVSLFVPEAEAAARRAAEVQSAAPLPANTFSDLPQRRGAVVGSVTIVLLDNLNTLTGGMTPYEATPMWVEDHALANAKNHLVQFIKNLNPADRVAIYGLTDSLHVVCDFTNDREQLLAIVEHYDPTSKTHREVVDPAATHTPIPGLFNPSVDRERVNLASMANQNRSEVTMHALAAIAGHVASVPGRKNLVWLTANLPLSPAAVAGILSRAQIAAYPVDGRGLLTFTAPANEDDMADEDRMRRRGSSMPGQTAQPIGIDAMDRIADLTGGKAFVNTNDLTNAIRSAVEDSAVTYTLGFYAPSESIDGKFHELKVVAKPKGLMLRYPKGYFAVKDAPASGDEVRGNLIAAFRSPIESSSIPVEARIDRVDQPVPNSLSVFGAIDVRRLRLAKDGETQTGAVVISVVQEDQTGKVLSQATNKYDLKFSEAQYAQALKSGIPFKQPVAPKDGVWTLRVVVEDQATALVGSLIIPLSQVR